MKNPVLSSLSVNLLRRSWRVVLAVHLLMAGMAANSRAGSYLYKQPPRTDGMYTIWASGSTADGVYARVWDSFTLDASAEIGVVQWEGAYIDQENHAANPTEPNTDNFEISVWSDKSGQPGEILAKVKVSLADAHPKSLGTLDFPFPEGDTVTIPLYAYSATLPTPIAVAAGQRYWLSIISNSTLLEPNWSWMSGTGPDSASIQEFAGERSRRDYDRLFALKAAAKLKATVSTTVSTAHVASGVPGVFTFKLSAAQPEATVVRFKLGGDAVNGQDYAAVGDSVTIAAGQTGADVQIVPLGDPSGAKKKVKLTLVKDAAYKVGTTEAVKVKIVD